MRHFENSDFDDFQCTSHAGTWFANPYELSRKRSRAAVPALIVRVIQHFGHAPYWSQ